LAAILAAGCASNPSADPELARAESRVQQAQQAGATRGGGGAELDAGEDRLRAARDAAAKGDNEEAARLARHAELDAALAEAKARRQQAETAAEEVRAATSALRNEADRVQMNSTPTTIPPAGGLTQGTTP